MLSFPMDVVLVPAGRVFVLPASSTAFARAELRAFLVVVGRALSAQLQLQLTSSSMSQVRCRRPGGYLVWSITFFLGVGLTDLGDFGRYWGQNKAVVSDFSGSVVHCNVGIVLIFLARVVAPVTNFTSSYFGKIILAVEYR
jgi:hypothetical protein